MFIASEELVMLSIIYVMSHMYTDNKKWYHYDTGYDTDILNLCLCTLKRTKFLARFKNLYLHFMSVKREMSSRAFTSYVIDNISMILQNIFNYTSHKLHYSRTNYIHS